MLTFLSNLEVLRYQNSTADKILFFLKITTFTLNTFIYSSKPDCNFVPLFQADFFEDCKIALSRNIHTCKFCTMKAFLNLGNKVTGRKVKAVWWMPNQLNLIFF